MKKLIFILLLAGIINACTEKNQDHFTSDQAEIEEKLEVIQSLVKKYGLADSLFHNIARIKSEKPKEFIELDLVTLEEQLGAWAEIQKEIGPYQEEMKKWAELDRNKWAEIEAETDSTKKAALEKEYWSDFFPEMKKASDAINAKMNSQIAK